MTMDDRHHSTHPRPGAGAPGAGWKDAMTTEAGLPAAAHALPAWSSVLAVVAHPDDESFGLGAVLDAFARSGATVSVLCFTRGEASSLPSVSGDLDLLRAAELQSAAAALGLDSAILSDHPDGALAGVDQGALVAEVSAAIGRAHPVGLVVFDPSGVTGHPDHVAASAAALRAAAMSDLPVLGNLTREGPAEHWQIRHRCGAQCGGAGRDVVGVSGDSRGIEDDQAHRLRPADRRAHLRGEFALIDAVQGAVGVVAEDGRVQPQGRRRTLQLRRPQEIQIPGDTKEAGSLPTGKTQHRDASSGPSKGVQHRPQAERFIIGVRHHRQHR